MKEKIITRNSGKSLYGLKLSFVLLLAPIVALGILFGDSTTFSSGGQSVAAQTKSKNPRQPILTPESDDAFNRLIEFARTKGSARFIVGLPVDFAPESSLTDADTHRQRREIRAAQNNFLGRLAPFAVKDVKQFDFIPFVAMKADASALEFIKTSGEVTFIQEDALERSSLLQSTALVGAPAAWSVGLSGSGQTVAVLDTGVDKAHEFLAGKVVSEACYSTTDPAGNATSVCPGGVAASTGSGSGVHCDATIDGCTHGTHVAGIVAGRGANGSATHGVAKDANLIAMQVFSRIDDAEACGDLSSPCALTYTSDQISALERVYALRDVYRIAAVNMSLGGGKYTSNCDAAEAARKAAIDNLRAAKIATVIASGNDEHTDGIAAPACISTAVSVGSTRDADISGSGTIDTVSAFSNSASFLSILAPGEKINSSYPNNTYANIQGTSMAAPHVAGAFAILKNRNADASVTQIFDALNSTGVPVTDHRNGVTKNRIKIDAAINALPPQDKIVFISGTGSDTEIYTMNGDGTNRTRITNNSDEETYPSFSPDGTKIVYDTGGGLFIINADGTNPRHIYQSYYSSYPSFSPDGSRIVFYENSNIYTIKTDGTDLRQLTDSGFALTPSWSPDGTKIAFMGLHPNGGSYALTVMNANGTNRQVLTPNGYSIFSPSYSPDGSRIAFRSNQGGQGQRIQAVNADGSSLTPTILSQGISGVDFDHDPDFSSDGNRILFTRFNYTNGTTSAIYSIPPGGGSAALISPIGFNQDSQARWYKQAPVFVAYTAAGQNVPVNLSDVQMNFSSISNAGTTTATAVSESNLPALPASYRMPANAPKYEITTTATFSNNIVVSFDVPGVADTASCNRLQILHYTNNDWDSSNNAAPVFNSATGVCTVRQTVTSLSPFVVAEVLAPTSASVTVSGIVLTASGRGISGARVKIINSSGEQRTAISNPFGYYNFAEVAAGETYVFSVSAKNHTFQNPTQVRSITENVSDVNFTAVD